MQTSADHPMPRRSTPFQRMVFHLQQQLTPEATVEESALLPERASRKLREVDVVIRSRVGKHEIVVALECVERKRKVTVPWVEQMTMKHQALPTHKLVLVSASGFTAPALEKAQALGIEAHSFETALDADWPAIIRDKELPLSLLNFHLHAVTLVFDTAGAEGEFPAGPSVPRWSSEGDRLGTLGEYIYPRLESWEVFGERAAELIGDDDTGVFGVELRSNPRFHVRDPQGEDHELAGVRAYIEFKVETVPLGFTQGALGGVPVGFGSGDSPLGEISVTVMEDHETLAGAMALFDPQVGDFQTVKLEAPPEPTAFRLVAQGGPLGFSRPAPPDPPDESQEE
jgi:hypothetical protein